MSTDYEQTERIFWPRCSRVEVEGDLFYCQLARERQYDPVEAYAKDPHLQFLNCRTAADVQSFVLEWGPLDYLHREEKRDGLAVRRISECLAYLTWLQALQRMMEAGKGRADWRAALLEFVRAEKQRHWNNRGNIPDLIFAQSLEFGVRGDLDEWIASASLDLVQRVVIRCVENKAMGPQGCLKVRSKGRGFELKPALELLSLWDALIWMLWQDEWNGRQPRPCPECRKIFRPPTAHDKKYCSPECAHRATNRKWRKKD